MYHRGYLFAGLPGTGKTSLVLALATHFKVPIYLLPISEFNSLQTIDKCLSTIEKNSIVLIEDIDRILKKETSESSSSNRCIINGEFVGDTRNILKNLLQTLDGTDTPHGCLFILTTNEKEVIDPALLRAGRCDRLFNFGYTEKEQARRMFLRFFPGEKSSAKAFANSIGTESVMADIQEYLLRNRNDVVKASIFNKNLETTV